MEMFYTKISEIVLLAHKLPTGITDPKAREKFYEEIDELSDAIRQGDYLGAVMEAADCAYYAVKKHVNYQISPTGRDALIRTVSRLVSLPDSAVLLDCVIAKMSLRAAPGNPKNDVAERAAVAKVLEKKQNISRKQYDC